MADEKAKKPKKTIFSLQGFDVNAYKQTEGYVHAIDALYNQAVQEFATVAGGVNFNPDKPFSFADYPQARNKAQQIINGLAAKMEGVIKQGSRNQWLYACKKNDEFLNHILNTSKVPKKQLAKYQDRNMKALDAFQTRKINGLDLSKRIWNYTGQLQTQMELGIDVALGEGKSAAQLSRDLRQYLVDPDKLFHKVKDKHGMLHISKNAAAFNPGQGKYRSSYKNAMRLTRSEINMAYRESDWLRWQNLDFVVGFEVKLSNNHTTLINGVPTPFTDICDELKGRYPKWFKWTSWHPQCRCHCIPIMKTDEEMDQEQLADLRAAWKGEAKKQFQSKNKVNDVPDNFKQFISDKAEVSAGWKSQPYWIKDNFNGGTIAGGLKVEPEASLNVVKPVISQPVQAKHEAPKQEPEKPNRIPDQLSKDSEYLKGKNIELKNDFFALLDPAKPVGLKVVKGDGSHYNPATKTVVIGDGQRLKNSDWFRERILYHEYGHAIDWQRNMRFSPEVRDLMDKYRKITKQKETYTRRVTEYDWDSRGYKNVKRTDVMPKLAIISDRVNNIYKRIVKMSPEVFKRRGLSKHDVIESIGAVQDTIMSLNPNYGWGHSKSYFKHAGMKEAEFIAHAFENAFGTNPVFKKYLPELYDDMVQYIKTLK